MAEPRHILIAEDEVLAALALERYLSHHGYRVSIAHDGLKALEVEERDPADALVTDLRMPRMDGLKLIRRVRERRADLPIVVMTGYLSGANGADELENGQRGPLVVLKKPVSPQEILTAVETLSRRENGPDGNANDA